MVPSYPPKKGTATHASLLFASLILMIMLTACGGVKTRVATTPEAKVLEIKEVELLPVSVISKEDDAETLQKNKDWSNLTEGRILTLLSTKGIKIDQHATYKVNCSVVIAYGNRLLTHLIGFGTGGEHVYVKLEMTNRNGQAIYAATSDADLGAVLGLGSMSTVIVKTIDEALMKFGETLLSRKEP